MSKDTKEYKNHTIDIAIDENPDSPRTWSNTCVFHIIHKKYAFGDKNYSSMEAFLEVIKEARRNKDIVLPLYMYDHSGITISLTPFACKWDSGQVGVVIIPRETMLKNFNKKTFTSALKKKALKIAESEVDIMNKYLQGYVYGYIVDAIHSCWGYYSVEDAVSEAKSIIDDVIIEETLKLTNR